MKYVYLLIIFSLLLIGCSKDVPTAVVPQEVVTETTPTPVVQAPPTTALSEYTGKILAGNKTPYIEFNIADYEKATTDGKVILLYFYSEINSGCRVDEVKIFKAFNDMANTKMIGFKVHFDDSLTTDAEKQLATTLGVTDARTKIILKSGKVVQPKTSTSWDTGTYAAQMSLYLN